jgi:hypothetical protein
MVGPFSRPLKLSTRMGTQPPCAWFSNSCRTVTVFLVWSQSAFPRDLIAARALLAAFSMRNAGEVPHQRSPLSNLLHQIMTRPAVIASRRSMLRPRPRRVFFRCPEGRASLPVLPYCIPDPSAYPESHRRIHRSFPQPAADPLGARLPRPRCNSSRCPLAMLIMPWSRVRECNFC